MADLEHHLIAAGKPVADMYRCDCGNVCRPFEIEMINGKGLCSCCRSNEQRIAASNVSITATWQDTLSEGRRLLRETDWTRLDDTPLSERARWAFYRAVIWSIILDPNHPTSPMWPVRPT